MFYPLHRIKILLQTQDSNPLITSGQVRRYTIVDSVPRLLREGGVRELWRGNGAYMLRHVPSTTLSFAFKDALLRHPTSGINLAPPGRLLSRRMASELRKQKKSIGMLETLKSTQRAGGLRALYRGYGVSALAIGAYKSLYFGLYDTAVAAMEQRWAAANVVVLAASSITYPLDVVRKRLVADTAMGPGRQQFRGFMDCVTKIVRTEGLPGFYRFYGYDMLLRLGGGVLLVLYDELKAHGAGRMRQQRVPSGDRASHGYASNIAEGHDCRGG
eukprot:XP_001691371.1 ADP/ATP carrier protein [Chlamydomonas reinhardtii]